MNWLKQMIGLSSRAQEAPLEEAPPPPPTEEIAISNPIHSSQPLISQEDPLPTWLTNEEVLRDEGVLYGLSGTDPQTKTQIVHALYKKRTAPLTQLREELTEKIGELNLVLEKKNSDLTARKLSFQQLTETEPVPENTLRVAVGLLLAIGMSAGNYFLIREGIALGFIHHTEAITFGVFLSGMFSLYHATSVIHTQERITWRRALEEFGMPLAASAFVFVQVLPFKAWYQSLAYLGFTFFAFLISGKLLLGSVALLKGQLRSYFANKRLGREQQKAKAEEPAEWARLEQEMENIRLEKWKIVNQLNDVEAQLGQYHAEKEAAIHIFLSEFQLASDYRSKLNPKQFSEILNK